MIVKNVHKVLITLLKAVLTKMIASNVLKEHTIIKLGVLASNPV